MVLTCFVFPDDRNVWWRDILKSSSNPELSFAGPYLVAVGCQSHILKNAVKCLSQRSCSDNDM